jgi:formate hydrogenlyase subunit 6/NADH:ubiquinone oxidoreductase subunit I
MALLSKQERRHFPDWDDPTQCQFHRVKIDLDKCDGCKLCTLACPATVLELFTENGKKKARVKKSHRGCVSCNNCYAICETGAIEASRSYDFVGYYRQLGRGEFSKPRMF